MARRRTLQPEEEELWRTVARTARPLHEHPIFHKPEPVATPAPLSHAKPRLNPFILGERARSGETHDLVPSPPSLLAAAPLQMDAKTHGKMTRGKLAPEARIDLHGMTLAEAHPELIHFILGAQSAGLRLVLVITGKGKRRDDLGPIPQRTGALRHQVPQWLRLPPLGQAVLQVSEAHLKHGGSGAYYVYLRRR
ncbi:MAG: Smr/MutS family protein [Tabrizicola sp.]|uniref:Smr/MutS family protein n=1 Tax=Tabrizicola sp. TaxID=2005166 RepID=UPI0027325CD9|nr:Smr/MutS family protein [Tabrizicola sp.]MDP3261633.1 Smr/MutS family protein [Tabrizicola sp.]MDP3648297.1 Smr/MutS family protein [Paracoccaceae bacterium]MDZ4065592.1 Smr/MutS family protein [Tabrizicola sp.]